MCRGTATLRSLTKKLPQLLCACTVLWWRSRSPRIAVTSSAAQGTASSLSSPASLRPFAALSRYRTRLRSATRPSPKTDGCSSALASTSGDVIAEENNLYGTGVNVAVRLEQLAEAGGICISQTVYDQVRKIVEIPFEDIGEHRLKNIAEPVHVYRILPAPLPWLNRLFSRTNIRRQRLGVAAGVLLLLLAVGGRIVLSASAGCAMGRPFGRRTFAPRPRGHRCSAL